MCGCKRRRAARQAWLEQRSGVAPGPFCGGRGFGPSGGPPFRPPFAGGGGGPFSRWRDAPPVREPEYRDIPPQQVPREAHVQFRDVEKGPIIEKNPTSLERAERSVSFMSSPFSRLRSSLRSNRTDMTRDSTATQLPQYTSGGVEVVDEKKRESLPPAYDAAAKW
ncbi:hypothetical protein C8035_v007255 [Colletotrichum spinosum]|uniref:Uncharacterized protein n=1 Tax=Colletotrichum spinosum TaxID=1347390 RepID=A0A4R8QJV4_9PEZI|nr:hypothetical protein C8035_v007255 [Colletotrichum spinosum]